MNKTLEGMARAEWATHYTSSYDTHCGCKEDWQKGLQAALLWLAANVSDEMVFAAIAPDEPNMAHFKDAFRGTIEGARKEISAALRAAAGDGK